MTKIFTEEENRTWSKQLPGKMCSSCLILRANGKVLMVKAGYKDHWTFPSGVVDENESPKSAALREAQEEVGVRVDPAECALFTTIYTSSKNGDRDRFNFSFIVDLPDTEVVLSVPNDEITEAAWVDFHQVAELSNHKGSYVELEKILTGKSTVRAYIEV